MTNICKQKSNSIDIYTIGLDRAPFSISQSDSPLTYDAVSINTDATAKNPEATAAPLKQKIQHTLVRLLHMSDIQWRVLVLLAAWDRKGLMLTSLRNCSQDL